MNFYYYSLCHVCKRNSKDLKRCASCKLLSYCSREHQLSDWGNHKHLCKIIKKCNSKYGKIENSSQLRQYKINSQLYWVNELKRPLKTFESQMWMFPRLCNVCFSMENLFNCPYCDYTAYCSEKHKTDDVNHATFCPLLKLCMKVDCYLYLNRMPDLIHDNIPECDEFPKSIHGYMNLFGYTNSFESINDEIEYVLKADYIVPAANIINVMLKANIVITKDLVIHVVGSENYEVCIDWLFTFECLFHWLKIDSVQIILIGPEMHSEREKTDFSVFLCDRCKEINKKAYVTCYQNLYHVVVDKLEKPCLMIAFNSGLHEFEETSKDTWKLSVLSLVHYIDTPLLLTAYTEEEIKKDIQRFNTLDKSVRVLICERNPFSSLRPLRDSSTEGIPIFYVHKYSAILQRSQ